MEKIKDAKRNISSYNKVMIAFSGGVDSLTLLKLAVDVLGCKSVLAVTIKSPFSIPAETERVEVMSNFFNVEHKIVDLDELNVSRIVRNQADRCYFCKKFRYEYLLKISKENGCEVIFDGSNFSDVDDYRPGMKACAELGIISPLKEAGLTKEEIVFFLKEQGLQHWNYPARACLASRVAYGIPITYDLLEKIKTAEEFLSNAGFADLRVRVHGDIVRIEVPQQEIPLFLNNNKLLNEIVLLLKNFNFKFITLDLEGLRSGSLIPLEKRGGENENL